MQKISSLGDFNAINPQNHSKNIKLGDFNAIIPQSCAKIASLGNCIAITPQSYEKIQVRRELVFLHFISFFIKIFRPAVERKGSQLIAQGNALGCGKGVKKGQKNGVF